MSLNPNVIMSRSGPDFLQVKVIPSAFGSKSGLLSQMSAF